MKQSVFTVSENSPLSRRFYRLRLRGDLSAEPAPVTVAGKQAYISALNELHLAEFVDQQIDVTDLSAPLTRNVALNKPADVVYVSNDTVMITIEIAPK